MPKGKVAKINRKIARATKKPNSKTGERYKNVTEAREAGVELPTAAERVATIKPVTKLVTKLVTKPIILPVTTKKPTKK